MSKKGDIYLGGSGGTLQLLSPFGRTLSIGDVEISRTDRTASGKLRKDVITTKKKFTLAYSEIDGDELEKILDLYDLADELTLQIWTVTTDGTTTTSGPDTLYYDEYTVLMEPIDRTRLLLTGEGLWTGVTVELNEV